jgi:hypothetical protein
VSVAEEQGEVVQTKYQVVDTGIEALHCGALQRRAPFYAKVLEGIDNGAGYWQYLKVGIFQRPEADLKVTGYSEPLVSDTDVQIGEYQRNYSTLYRTFHPFQLRGKWYALYSKDYTSTRIMSLPDCKDIGGEDRDCWGFCPTDFWVPGLHYIQSVCDPGCPREKSATHTPDFTKACTCTIVHDPDTCPQVNKTVWEKLNNTSRSCTCKERWAAWYEKHHIWHFPDRVHGFVAGCVWGDDTSWKIEYLDLSKADEGIIKREARFGYIEMPAHLDLSKAVNLEAGDGYTWLRIATETNYDLETGKRSDEE